MKSTVYIETTIPSFYHETRESAEFVAMKNWTRQWWEARRSCFICYTSIAVLDELEAGNHPKKEKKMHFLKELEYLDINDELRREPIDSDELDDDLYPEICGIIKSLDDISISSLQRRYRIGFNRSARLIERLELDGLIAPAQGSKARKILH